MVSLQGTEYYEHYGTTEKYHCRSLKLQLDISALQQSIQGVSGPLKGIITEYSRSLWALLNPTGHPSGPWITARYPRGPWITVGHPRDP